MDGEERRMIMDRIKGLLEEKKSKLRWRQKNAHNSTVSMNMFNQDHVNVGRYTYGALTVLDFGQDRRLKIGSFCSIASGVTFVLNADHNVNHISTFPFRSKMLGGALTEAYSKGDIIVEDDVWIGQNAVILSGVRIGQGAVIGAGAVVNRDIPPYAIAGGVPAKVIKYRFSEDLIRELKRVDYSKLSREMAESHLEELYQDLKEPSQLAWLPKKD